MFRSSKIHLFYCSENLPCRANRFTHQLLFSLSAKPIFAHELSAQRRKGRRVVNVYVLSLLFLKLIVVKRGLAYPCRRGAVWSWQSFVHQSPEQRARGRRRSGHSNVRTKSARNWMKGAKLDRREKWLTDGARNERDFTRWVFSLPWITSGIQHLVGLPRS